jgi:hypothetical protein
LLQDTNRLGEAEPLMRRTLLIALNFQHQTGHVHPSRDGRAERYYSILSALGHDEAAIRAAFESILREAGLAEMTETLVQTPPPRRSWWNILRSGRVRPPT